MSVVVVTGSGGLIGSEAARHFAALGLDVVGIDNDLRRAFFGEAASTAGSAARLARDLGPRYRHHDVDIRDEQGIGRIFERLGTDVALVIHAAAQPSHDWAAKDPSTDFTINAQGTLILLEAVRHHCAEAPFIFMSTNKVYGDRPNSLRYTELATRYELDAADPCHGGIDETMSIDGCLHSVFGASKVAADVMVQEYGRYFGLNTVCFRGGTLTGSGHAASELHGFLAYLLHCTVVGTPYRVFGFKGKQVRDVIHSRDVIGAFDAYARAPRSGAVYNLGGGRHSNCSVLEAIQLSQDVVGAHLSYTYVDEQRIGDHQWWISDNGRFERDYPAWRMTLGLADIAQEIYETNRARWLGGS